MSEKWEPEGSMYNLRSASNRRAEVRERIFGCSDEAIDIIEAVLEGKFDSDYPLKKPFPIREEPYYNPDHGQFEIVVRDCLVQMAPRDMRRWIGPDEVGE